MRLFLSIVVLLTISSCQERSDSIKKSTEENDSIIGLDDNKVNRKMVKDTILTIEDIQSEYQKIVSNIENQQFDSTSFNYNCHDEKKGVVTYFRENGKLLLISHSYNEYSHFSAVDQYFLKDEKPFFVFYTQRTWSFVDETQTKENVMEKRFYIINNKPIRCLEKKFTYLSPSEDPTQSGNALNKEVDCSQLKPVMEDFDLLFELRNQKEDLTCLEQIGN